MLDALRAKLEAAGLDIVDISIQRLVVRSGNNEAELSLQNLYRILMNSKRELHDQQLDHFTEQVCAQLTPTHIPSTLFPLLAPDIPDKRLHAPWSAPLIPDVLRLLLCFERGERMSLLSPMDVVRSGKSMNELKKEAMENLFRISSIHQPQKDTLNQYRFELGDGYDASRFLMIRYWFPKENLWIAIPARDSLWIRTSPPDEASNQALHRSYSDLPYPLLEHWIQLPQGTLDSTQQDHS